MLENAINDIDTCVLLLLAYLFLLVCVCYLFLFVCVCVCVNCFSSCLSSSCVLTCGAADHLDEVRVNILALCAVYISSQKTKDTLDKTEGAMTNGQTRYTGNMRNTRHRTFITEC
jgi:hypothetical protein